MTYVVVPCCSCMLELFLTQTGFVQSLVAMRFHPTVSDDTRHSQNAGCCFGPLAKRAPGELLDNNKHRGCLWAFVKTRNKGYCQGHAMCWYHRFGFQIRTSASIPRISCCNGRGIQWLWYREQPNKGQSCNGGASRTMTTSRIKLICPKLQPHCHPCPIYFIQFQQHHITKWSIVLQNITQSCLEIFAIFW